MSITRNQLRAARVLLCLSQEELSALAKVGVATIRRYESGAGATKQNLETLRATVEAAGAIVLDPQEIGGRRIGDGVALADEAELPPKTLKRIQARMEGDPQDRSGSAGRPYKKRDPTLQRRRKQAEDAGGGPAGEPASPPQVEPPVPRRSRRTRP